LKGSKSDPASVIVSGVIDASATRLDASHDQFPNRRSKQPITGNDYGGALDVSARAHLQTRAFTTSPSTYGDPFHPVVRGQCLVN